MKNRLQTLWDEVVPHSGPCPQPDAASVRRRVDAALDGRPRAVSRRTPRLVVLAAAAVLLLAGTVLAGEELIPPEFNVLSVNFRGENSEEVIAMMTITPVSVEDDNFTMTVTSSLADGNELYFTLVVEPKNDEARQRLQDARVIDLLRWRVLGDSGSAGMSSYYDEEADARLFDVSVNWWPIGHAAVRLDLMDAGVWLRFPVKAVRSVTLKVNAEAQGVSSRKAFDALVPVTVEKVEISPLSYLLRYTAPDLDTDPVVYFLFRDGSIRTPSQLKATGPSGSGRYKDDDQAARFKYSWKFGAVQDLSELEAIVLGGTAYPLSGSEPYAVDVSGIPLPFVLPMGEASPSIGENPVGEPSVPLFALCDGLDADCRWDEAAGVAVAAFRGVTLTFTVGSETVQVDDLGAPDTFEAHAAPVYRDGELWVFGERLFRAGWDVNLRQAIEDWEHPQKAEDGSGVFTLWIVNP